MSVARLWEISKMIEPYFDYHVRRIINATNDLWMEPDSICEKCHTPESINCILCYCPWYELGINCGGDFVILENGVKDCSNCNIPHDPVFVKEYLRPRLSRLITLKY